MKQLLLIICIQLLPAMIIAQTQTGTIDSSYHKSQVGQKTVDSSRADQLVKQQNTTLKKDAEVPLHYKLLEIIIGIIVGVVGMLLAFRDRLFAKTDARNKRIADEDGKDIYLAKKLQKQILSAEEEYPKVLEEHINKIKLLGTPRLSNIQVDLLDTFVPMQVSEEWRTESRFDEQEMRAMQQMHDRSFSQDEVMKHAFRNKRRVLLIIGDPGAGKTTLFYYFALKCLKNDFNKLGFDEPVLPIYFPLRELEFDTNKKPLLLWENLGKWAESHAMEYADEQTFKRWVHDRKTLLLLDGLDEISDPDKRKNTCLWIDGLVSGLPKACFVVSSRWTGYRVDLGIQLGCHHLRADVRDFSPEQQKTFLNKWLKAAFLQDLSDTATKQEKEREAQKAEEHAKKIIVYLEDEKNKALRTMAAVPMLLQIMALLWKDYEYLPDSISGLFETSLHYLLEYRDRRRNIIPPLPAKKSQTVLAPVALWMQEVIQKDMVIRDQLHEKVHQQLLHINPPVDLEKFCNFICERAGIIAECGKDHYIFRHKSFREYLAGHQLAKECKNTKRLENFIQNFGDDWWEETCRFLVREGDSSVFKAFIEALFNSPKSKELSQKEQNLLQTIVQEAAGIDLTVFKTFLNDTRCTENQHRYILECLKTAGTDEAYALIKQYIDSPKSKEAASAYAQGIYAQTTIAYTFSTKDHVTVTTQKNKFTNPIELNAEYILIPGGSYKYSATNEIVTVPDLYFAKFPVTFKQFQLFTDYLDGKNAEINSALPFDDFINYFGLFIDSDVGLKGNVPKQPDEWKKTFISTYINEKRFNGPDQPVVRVDWYTARAYCFWLSCCEHAQHSKKQWKPEYGATFRLPTEQEWYWAAAGREPDGSLREYPWKKENGEPNERLANFGGKVGATTPVGRYPEGATPEGLMDMAGNVWEWMDNKYQAGGEARPLRGGSWSLDSSSCRCADRDYFHPGIRYFNVGFRCARINF